MKCSILYERQHPETTLLYQLVERHYPEFLAALAERDRYLPRYVQDEFETYLKCGRLDHDFLQVRCTTCQAEQLMAFSCKRRGFWRAHHGFAQQTNGSGIV